MQTESCIHIYIILNAHCKMWAYCTTIYSTFSFCDILCTGYIWSRISGENASVTPEIEKVELLRKCKFLLKNSVNLSFILSLSVDNLNLSIFRTNTVNTSVQFFGEAEPCLISLCAHIALNPFRYSINKSNRNRHDCHFIECTVSIMSFKLYFAIA